MHLVKGVLMRSLIILLAVMLYTGCALLPFDIQWAPPKYDEAVVFDIDGTLTPKPSAMNTVRDDAANAVRLYADKGYKIIYLSARIKLFQSRIPDWLKKNHFPVGSIHVPQTKIDSSDHSAFKKNILNRYKEKGWKFVAAFGDSSTDFEAYADVGIKKDQVFALKRVGKTSCQPGIWTMCFSSWTEQIAEESR